MFMLAHYSRIDRVRYSRTSVLVQLVFWGSTSGDGGVVWLEQKWSYETWVGRDAMASTLTRVIVSPKPAKTTTGKSRITDASSPILKDKRD